MRDYTPPALTLRGRLEELTGASVTGTATDVPLSTPVTAPLSIFS
ncbi:hypothetical protein [Motilibacter aurantiacus]|nr:hypothetical protein [Motilibacter aurantiacus]